MKNKFILTGSVMVAIASVGFLQPMRAAEEDQKNEEKPAKTEKSSKVSSADKKFVQEAAKGGMMEVDWGKAASSRAQNADVKQFGQRMVTDHSKANNELKSIASKKGISIPKDESNVNFKTDAAYMSMMVKDHEKDLAEFQKQAKSGSDPDLKAFADKTSKIIEHHLAEARRINSALKHQTSSIAR
jgi:putative membrane protein